MFFGDQPERVILWLVCVVSSRIREFRSFVGRTKRQRVPAIERLLNKPELASLGPACISAEQGKLLGEG